MRLVLLAAFTICFFCEYPYAAAQTSEENLPQLEHLLKEKSLLKIRERLEVLTNAKWQDDDFDFVNGVVVRAPLRLTYEAAVNYELYPRMSSAIKKIHFDKEKNILEVMGEAGGLKLHSWFKVRFYEQKAVHYEVVRGDLGGFVAWTYFWNEGRGRTLVVARGQLPQGKKRFPALIQFAFPALAEVVLSQASKNLRNFIEDEYNQKRIGN